MFSSLLEVVSVPFDFSIQRKRCINKVWVHLGHSTNTEKERNALSLY